MDTPIRKMQKEKDYQKHKVLRRIKKRNKRQAKARETIATRQLKKLQGKPVEFNSGKDSDIQIKSANRGKFNATKKRTGKTTEQLAHSKNTLTRKRAIFALNARKWKY